jgi:HNH endonuclease
MHFTDDLPSKSQIFDYWKDRLSEFGFFIDWGEPGCWACGFHYGTKYDIKRPDASWDKILQCWDRIPLHRCHIIPRSLGGTDDASNRFLMCRECHDLAPNTIIPEIFFEWARAQNSDSRENTKIRTAFESFGIEASAHEDFCELIISGEFRSWMSGKFGLHRPQSQYAPLSSRFTPATWVGLAAHYWRIHSTSS